MRPMQGVSVYHAETKEPSNWRDRRCNHRVMRVPFSIPEMKNTRSFFPLCKTGWIRATGTPDRRQGTSAEAIDYVWSRAASILAAAERTDNSRFARGRMPICVRPFDQQAMLALIEEVLDAGKRQGFGLTRLWANMEWALEDLPACTISSSTRRG